MPVFRPPSARWQRAELRAPANRLAWQRFRAELSFPKPGYYEVWARAVDAGHLPIARGVALSADDRLRRDVISELMCHLEVDLAAVASRHRVAQSVFDPDLDRCAEFIQDGLLEMDGARLRVTEPARPVLRVIAAAFDSYARQPSTGPRHAVAV